MASDVSGIERCSLVVPAGVVPPNNNGLVLPRHQTDRDRSLRVLVGVYCNL